MTQRGIELDRETFSCPICLDLLTDSVTTPCGHSYCMNCIRSHWDEEDKKRLHSCPQCRQTFTQRPVLLKNTVLASVVEALKKTGLHDTPVGPEDVACDICTGTKLKAVKSCLVCRVSFCENHLQPHFESPAYKEHKLVNPSKNFQENFCSGHDEVVQLFCRTDQQFICYLCSMDEHKGHDTVPAAAERTKREREREVINQNILERANDVEVLQQEVAAINGFADDTVENSDKIFLKLVHLLKERHSDVTQQIRSQQHTEVSRVKELQEKLQQEIAELKSTYAVLKTLSHTTDHNQFLNWCPNINVCPQGYFGDVTVALSHLRERLQDALGDFSWTGTHMDNLVPEPETRAGFFKYSQEITLDPNTANGHLLLSEGNRKVKLTDKLQPYSDGPNRFALLPQVLSVEELTGRCYWEVKWSGDRVHVAVAYKNITKEGRSRDSLFGRNDKSWVLTCSSGGYEFYHNTFRTIITGPWTCRIGVYLDHSAGLLSFYSISDNMTLLHRIETRFTEPLYAGLLVYASSTVEVCKLQTD